MSQQLDTLARIGLAGAIVDTYRSGLLAGNQPEDAYVNRLLVQLQLTTERAFELYDRVTASGLKRIGQKIEALKNHTSIGKPLSILTFIDFAIAVMDQPARRSKGARGAVANDIVAILILLHREISGNREYFLSSMVAAKACDIWEALEI